MGDSGSFWLGAAGVFLISYLCGSLPSGYLIGKYNKIDIRDYGSHNIGATNVRRVLGRDWSILCFLMDFFKGFLPVLIVGHHWAASWTVGAGWGGLCAALGSVCGHMFPVWLKFKGGKGVATGLGVVAALAFFPALFGALVWLVIFEIGRMVSLASMLSVLSIAGIAALLRVTGLRYYSWPGVLVLFIIAVVVIIRHKDNIIRIFQGREPKFLRNSK